MTRQDWERLFVDCQMAKVAAFILAQFAQQLAQLGRGVVAQLGFLGSELWRKKLGKGIW